MSTTTSPRRALPTGAHVLPRLVERGQDLLHRALARRRPDAAARPPTVPGERLLHSARDDRDRPVVATSHGLYHRSDTDPANGWTRWGWELVHRVDWNADRRVLTLWGLGAQTAARAVLHLPANDRLARLAGERVAAHTVVDTAVWLGDGRSARVAGRRRPGSAELVWIVTRPGDRPGASVDPAGDDVLTGAIARLRRDLGL